jgi:hypothetical protein
MKRITQGLALTSLCLSLVGCGTARYYTLPVDPSHASETQTMMAACATELGLESYKQEELLAVKYDETANLYYRHDGGDALQLQVLVDDKRVPPADMNGKQAAVKAKGDEIYACAQARLYPPPPPPVVYAPPPPPPAPVVHADTTHTGMSLEMNANVSTGVSMSVKTTNTTTTASTSTTSASTTVTAGLSGTCGRALECYSQLQKTVCEGASDCSFKAEFSGSDDSACRDALVQANQTVKQLSAFKPGLRAPAVCKAE